MTIVILYLPILLSLSLTFFLHFFKKHVHSFFLLFVTTLKNININTTKNNYHHHDPIIKHTNGSPPLSLKVSVDVEINDVVNNLMCCNEIGGVNDDQIDKNEDHGDHDEDGIHMDNNNNIHNMDDENDELDEDDEGYWRRTRMMNDLNYSFPPPISSLNQKGQSNFALVPVRNNGRLQLQKVRIKRPDIVHALREGGRLRMYLVPNHEEEQEQEQEIEEDEERVEESEDEELFEDIAYDEKEDDEIVGEWRFPLEDHNNIDEGLRRCHHQVMNQCNHHQHYHHHNYFHMLYEIGIA